MKRVITTCIMCLIIMPALCLAGCLGKGVIVNIQNNSSKNIADVVIEYNGGKETIDEVKSGGTISKCVHPQGESSLSIFYRVDNLKVQKKLDIYIEPTSVGKLYITISDNGQLTFRSEIGI